MIIENQTRNKVCKDVANNFGERFPGLLLIWSEMDRNSREVQKFRLMDSISGQKLRLVFISNESFEDETIDSFIRKFEEKLKDYAIKSSLSIKYKNSRLLVEKNVLRGQDEY